MNSAMKETGCESGGGVTQPPALQVKCLGSSPHVFLGFNPSFVTAGKCDIAACVGIISSAAKRIRKETQTNVWKRIWNLKKRIQTMKQEQL